MAINVKELIKTTRSYEAKEITDEIFGTFLKENIVCRKYMPISEKISVIGSVMEYCSNKLNSKDIIDFSIKTECYLKLKLMFTYCGIKHNNSNLDNKTYDFICESGLMDFMVSGIGADYYETIDMFNRLYLVNSIKSISDTLVMPDFNMLKNTISDFKETLDHGKGIETLTKLVDGK